MDREIIDALLGLLDQRVAEELPRQLFGFAVDFLERLIDRNRADRHGRVAQNPLARFVDVLSGREIHHGVRAPARRPRHLLDLFVDRGANRRVADVGVDLHQEVTADDHRLALGMIDVRRQDRAPARELVADELRLDALAQRDELHLARDLAAPRVVHLRHVRSRFRAARSARRRKAQTVELAHRIAAAPVDRRRLLEFDGVAARHDPRLAQRRQPAANVDRVFRIGVWPARVVERVDGSIRQRDRAARNANRGVGPLNVNPHSNLPTPALPGSGRLRSASLGLALSARDARFARAPPFAPAFGWITPAAPLFPRQRARCNGAGQAIDRSSPFARDAVWR